MMAVHIGKLIKQTIKERGISVSEFARRITTSRENVYGIFRRQSLDTALLQKVSKVLEKDFFEYLQTEATVVVKEPVLSYKKKVKTSIDAKDTLHSKVLLLEKELSALKKELQLKDKIIALLEERIGKK